MKIIRNHLIVTVLASCFLVSCASQDRHEKVTQEKANQAGLAAVNTKRFDGTFMVPGTSFAQYKKILVEQLDMSDIKIIQPSSRSMTKKWELTDKDKRDYQERYTNALTDNLISDGRFTTSMESGNDVLQIKAKVLEIAPLASKEHMEGLSSPVQVYSEGVGTMTLEISLYDSATNKLVGIISDRRDLGSIWERNNQLTYNRQVSLAFNAWLGKLRAEIDTL
jgi:Protein of unknown function (DUF3313)